MEAVKSMALLNVSGMDGYLALIYKKYWHIVGEEISHYCLKVLNGRKEVEDINSTSIVLIPKVNDPNSMSQFRPISVCKVVYKFISKVVINRFRTVLDNCIDEAQAAFVPSDK